MPRALQFKSKKDGGMLSPEWMNWMEKEKPLGPIIYEYVVPRKTRQERYARSHEVHFCAVINDKFYDTDIATEFWVQYTKLLGYDPCAKHYYRTGDGEFFSITAMLGKKDQFSIVPEKEMKKLLRNEPTLYAAYIPHASENKDLREYTVRQKKKEEEEAKKKEQEKQAKQTVAMKVKEEKPVRKKEVEKPKSNNPFKKWAKSIKDNSEQEVSANVDDKKEDIGKDHTKIESKLDFSDNSKNEREEKNTAIEEKTTPKGSADSVSSKMLDGSTVNERKKDKPKMSAPENTVSEDMDGLTDMADVFNACSEANAEEQESDNNKKPQNSGTKNKKADNQKKGNVTPQRKKNEENNQSTKEKDNPEQKVEQKKNNEDKANVVNTESNNVNERPVKSAPKKQRQKRKGSQMTDLPNDIGYDNVAAVEKQQALENAVLEEPVQEEDKIEEELEKAEKKKEEKKNQEKFKNLDKAASNMDAMKYRTVSED